MNTPRQLLGRIRLLVIVIMVGLIVSGLTAIPLETEMRWLNHALGINTTEATTHSGLEHWLTKVHDGLKDTNERYPFIAYGTDWLAFGHLMIALVFVGAWRDPVRNKWLFDYGLVAGLLALMTVLLLGFAPVAWVFSQSTESVVMMGFLHLIFWSIAAYFGVRFLLAGFLAQRMNHPSAIGLWTIIFMFVMLQMSTSLRPIIGEAETLLPTEKKFFLVHWAESLRDSRTNDTPFR